jgi:hypothetical protein
MARKRATARLVMSTPNESPPVLVWYAVYGSSLSRTRFMCYLEGGRPTPSARRAHRRCAAGTQIQADRPIQLEFELYFAQKSDQWAGGGVAFVRTERVKLAATLGRAYLLTLPQLIHIAGEENSGHARVNISKEQLKGHPKIVTASGRGWYRVLLPCGSLDEIPMVTLTGPEENIRHQNSPSQDYLDCIKNGIRETYPQMKESDIERYIEKALNCDVMRPTKIGVMLRKCRELLQRFVTALRHWPPKLYSGLIEQFEDYLVNSIC